MSLRLRRAGIQRHRNGGSSMRRDFVYNDNGWGPHAPRVDVHEVPGDHDSMVLEPNVRALAARLKARRERTAAEVAEKSKRVGGLG